MSNNSGISMYNFILDGKPMKNKSENVLNETVI